MTEGRDGQWHEVVTRLQAEVETLRRDLTTLTETVKTLRSHYAATCSQCGTAYDLLANHYSVGLFDNVVYAKCPKCQKAVAIEGLREGGIRLVTEK
ncbi:MAG: hypothetical protein HY208_06895 [Nitrospirae bacterium]|nr:hypothetical protein [Nitrospirota bacterium]